MRLDDLRPTENVDDRRGSGFGGGRLGIGGGGMDIAPMAMAAISSALGRADAFGGGTGGTLTGVVQGASQGVAKPELQISAIVGRSGQSAFI